jgi:hypothetical protein
MRHDGYSPPYIQTPPGSLLTGIDACPRLRPFLADLAPQPGGDADDLGLYAGDACLARGRFVTDMARAGVSDCGHFLRIWRRRLVDDADDLGVYAGDTCLARGRFVTDMAAWKLDSPTRRRKLGGALFAGLTAPEARLNWAGDARSARRCPILRPFRSFAEVFPLLVPLCG